MRLAAAQHGVAVVQVHERVGARLQLAEHAQLVVEVVRAGAAARDDARCQIGGREPLDDAHERLEQLARASAPEVVVDRVLVIADVALDARVGQPVGLRHLPRERDGAVGIGDARAAAADLDVDQHLERPARAAPGLGQLLDVAGVVGDDDQAIGRGVERRKPLELRRRDDRA